MKKSNNISQRILSAENIKQEVKRIRLKSKTIVFTNGVFDILHEGHIAVLSEAASFGDVLIVGINSDDSVKKLKGESRPINNEHSRALIIASLIMVDYVIIFNEETPLELIKIIKPDVLVKGGDYKPETIVGSKEVLDAGGSIEIIPVREGFSTTEIIKKISKK
ncbi:MAG: D-glycero-beta-D-manno-heptose 1-phosphate adenylyltransferase [Ginsengibacter sp.]